jgi:hypothetical protein
MRPKYSIRPDAMSIFADAPFLAFSGATYFWNSSSLSVTELKNTPDYSALFAARCEAH